MKYSTLILALALMLLATSTWAIEPVTKAPQPRSHDFRDVRWYLTAPTFLTDHVSNHEIRTIVDVCAARVQVLLSNLANARTQRETGALIRDINRLERDRDIDILSVFIRRAENSGQYGLAQGFKEQRERLRRSGRGLELAVSD